MTDQAKRVVTDFLKVVMSGGDAAAADQFIDASFHDHQPWPGHPGTLEGFKAGLVEFRQAFPDARFEVERLVAEKDVVSALVTLSGTHLGPFMGAPASGKTFRVQALDMVRIDKGRMVEHWGFFDTDTLAQQLGLAPPT